MTSQSKICIVNGHSTIKTYLNELDEKILLYSEGKAQYCLNLSVINEKELQDFGQNENLWKSVGCQEEIDVSAIIYNISKDCIIPMNKHALNIKDLKEQKDKNKFKHLLINIDNRITDKSDIDRLLKELPIEHVVIVKPVEKIASAEEEEVVYEDRFGKPIVVKKQPLVVNNDNNSVGKENVSHREFKYSFAIFSILSGIWSNKIISILAVIGLFIGFNLRHS